MISRLAYGAVFVLLLPLALVLWAARLDQLLVLAPPPAAWAGRWIATAGIGLMVAGTQALWRHGRGLPMSAFPPERLVTRGVYRVFANPLYVGAVLVAFGVSLALQSPAGAWIVSPALAAMATAWVLGFEAAHTQSLFGASPRPLLHLPDDVPRAPTAWERAAVVVRVFVPWLIAYQAVEWLGAPRDAITVPRLPGERAWPVLAWTESLYLLTYVMTIAAPFVASRASDLRRFAEDGLVATASIIPFYLLVPLSVQAKDVPTDSLWTPMLLWERAGDASVTAFPAFHVVWTLISARLLTTRWPRARVLWIAITAGVAVSCVTTGMHSVLDVLAGVLAYVLVRRSTSIWVALCGLTERVANSWREWRLGPARLLNHGLYAACGGVGGVAIATALAGQGAFAWIVVTTVVAIVGAGAWAQIVEGSPALLRPFGFFGAVLGFLAMTGAALLTGHDGWLLLAAMSTGGCVTVALGRMRCLVQGCCHGRPVDAPWGIHYVHPRSRVVRLSTLGGVAVHPAPLYSILWALASGTVLARLWWMAAPLPFIAGVASMLAGLGRFVEEHFRGEPQTAQVAGLRLYQWLALAMILVGGALTCVAGHPAPAPEPLTPETWPVLGVLFVFTYAAYGLDFPESNARFARLT